MKSPKRVAVTGAAGQIAYNLLFQLADGKLFGPDEQIILHLLDLEALLKPLEGVAEELKDCAFPLLKEIRLGSNPEKMFEGVDIAFLIGAKPRSASMQRKDLLVENGKIFAAHGKALSQSASPDARILVIGNPCNTNCLIALHHAPGLSKKNFFSMTRLDELRARFQLAQKAKAKVEEVKQMTIWGNHSSTQVPDFFHAKIRGRPVVDVIGDRSWLEDEFMPKVQHRGTEMIQLRGRSSAASAAYAALDTMKTIVEPASWFSCGVFAAKNPYGIDENLVFSFPCQSNAGQVEVIDKLEWNAFLKEKIAITEKELIEERNMIAHLLK